MDKRYTVITEYFGFDSNQITTPVDNYIYKNNIPYVALEKYGKGSFWIRYYTMEARDALALKLVFPNVEMREYK